MLAPSLSTSQSRSRQRQQRHTRGTGRRESGPALPAAPLMASAAPRPAVIDGSPDGFGQQINVQFVARGSSLAEQFHPDELGSALTRHVKYLPPPPACKTWSGSGGVWVGGWRKKAGQCLFSRFEFPIVIFNKADAGPSPQTLQTGVGGGGGGGASLSGDYVSRPVRSIINRLVSTLS